MIQEISKNSKYFADAFYKSEQKDIKNALYNNKSAEKSIENKPKKEVEDDLKNEHPLSNKNLVSYDKLSQKFAEVLNDERLGVEFTKDKETQIMIVRIVDRKTDETIKQVPPEVTIKIAKMISNLTDAGTITNTIV